MKTHELKTVQPFFDQIFVSKFFELRKNDRDFHCGDILILKEYDPHTDKYTGREKIAKVTFVLSAWSGLESNYAILSIVPDQVEPVNSVPVIDFARRVARVMKKQMSSTIIFIMQQAYPDDVQGLDQSSTDILDNIITLTSIDQVEPDRDKDLKCLLEMQNLLKDTIYRADGAKTQLLSEMIADWINELLKPEETK